MLFTSFGGFYCCRHSGSQFIDFCFFLMRTKSCCSCFILLSCRSQIGLNVVWFSERLFFFLLFFFAEKYRRVCEENLPLLFFSPRQPALPPPQLPVLGSEADRVTPTPPFLFLQLHSGTPPLDGGGTRTHRHLVSPHLCTQRARTLARSLALSQLVSAALHTHTHTHTHNSWPPR